MEESLRQAYLEAMGIETWVFQHVELDEGKSELELIESDLAGSSNQSMGGENQITENKNPVLPKELPASEQRLAKQKPDLPVSSPPLKNTPDSQVDEPSVNSDVLNVENPHFAFVSLWTSAGTLLLVELQDPLAPGLSSSEYALLESILFAIKQKPAIDAPLDKELFCWPALVGAHQDRSVNAARQAVKAFINGKLKRQGLQALLILGRDVTQQAEEYLLNKGSIETMSTLSLSEMLINPSTKASVWKAIQALLKLK